MTALITLHARLIAGLDAQAGWLLPSLARLVFAGTLLVYYWKSGLTKLGDGLLSPDVGAYIQILPRAFEAAGYNPQNLGPLATPIVLAGTWAEFVLPVLLVAGLATRLAALGMIGFVAVQTWVDIVGHGVSGADLGAWFDGAATAAIADQRAFWIVLLMVLVLKGGGPLSLDALLGRYASAARASAPQPR